MKLSPFPLILLIVSYLSPIFGFAQGNGKLTGIVTDSLRPLESVTVRLFPANTSSAIQTTVTDQNGAFQIGKPKAGDYFLSFTHTGFAEKKITIKVGAENEDQKISSVSLHSSSAELKEVIVSSKRALVEQSDDKIVFNAEDDPTNKTGTALDILRKTPFVTVDGEENIKVNGKSNFKVLLNGRETSMFARNIKEALRGFPGTLISKIEVITNPSAKYDGEGIGGIINIITRKKVVGYNGTLSTFSRSSDKLNNFSVNGNAKIGKVGFSLFLHSGFSDPVLQQNSNTTFPTVQTIYTRRSLDGNQYASAGWNFGNAEVSWEVDSLNTISVYSNVDSWSNKTRSDQNITTDFIASPTTVSYYHLDNKTNNPGVNVGSDYIRHFKKNKEREFSLRLLGEFGKSDSKLNSFQDNPGTDRYLINNSHAINNQYTLQADNSIPLKSGKLEGGLKAILRRASSDFQSLIKYDEAAKYQTNLSNTDFFNYDQDVLSFYSMYSLRMKKSSFRIGVRLEYTNVNGNFISSNTKVKNSYTTVLPNIQFTNRVSPVSTLVFAYTERLQRPFIWDLNPFVNNNDSLNISYGNPGLGPQTVHSVSTQWRYGKGSTFAGINLEGSYSDNKILQYSFFEPQTGITRTTSLNIGKEFQSSLNVNLNTSLTPKLNLFVDGSLRYSTVTNNRDASQSNKGFGYNFNLEMSYKFTERFVASTYLGLWKDPQTIQTSYPFSSWHNVAVNYKVFKDKINISVRAVNYYEKRRSFKTITKDQNFYNENVTTQIRRGAVLALTWNFGKLTESVSRKKGVNNDDLLTKPSNPNGN